MITNTKYTTPSANTAVMSTRGPMAAFSEMVAGGLVVPVVHTKERMAAMNMIRDQERNTAGIERKTQTFHHIEVVVACAAYIRVHEFKIERREDLKSITSAQRHAFLIERIVENRKM